MLAELASQAFWIGLLKIIGVNIVLSGDNAVVIALAARSLPARQQKAAIFWGSGAAVVMRIVLTIFAVALLALPWLKIIGSLLLFWIGIKLLVPEEDTGDIDASDNLIAAIRTILIADLVMSIDNVIAVAAAAQGSYVLLILGLAISIPLVIFGSQLLLHLM
ncbi:MAG: TerC family protein, partial [Betaproteobacteria bacterium]|nr:TerC family protein [Betaproteobacteria bacterium]